MKGYQKITTFFLLLLLNQGIFAADAKKINHFVHGPLLAQQTKASSAQVKATSQSKSSGNKLTLRYRTIRSINDIQDGDYFTIYSKEAGAYCWNQTQNKNITCDLKQPHIGAHFQVNRKQGARNFSLVGYDIFKSNDFNRYCGIAEGKNIWRCDSTGSVFLELPGYGYRVGGNCQAKADYIKFSEDHRFPVLRPSQDVMKNYCMRRCREMRNCAGFQMETSNYCNMNTLKEKRRDVQYQCGCKIVTKDGASETGGFEANNFYKSSADLPSTLYLRTKVFAPGHAGAHDLLRIRKAPKTADAVILSSHALNQPLYYDSENTEEVIADYEEKNAWDVFPFQRSDYTIERKTDYPGSNIRSIHADAKHCEEECNREGSCLGFYHLPAHKKTRTVKKIPSPLEKMLKNPATKSIAEKQIRGLRPVKETYTEPQKCWLKSYKSNKRNKNGNFYTKQITFEHDAVGIGPINIIGEQDTKFGKSALSDFDQKGCRELCNSKIECNAYISNGRYCALYKNVEAGKGHHYHLKTPVEGQIKDLKLYAKVKATKKTYDATDKKYHFVIRKLIGEDRPDISSKKDKLIARSISALKSKSRSKIKIEAEGACHPSKVRDLFEYSKCFKFDPESQLISPPSQRIKPEDVLNSNIKSGQSYCTLSEKPSVELKDLTDDQILLMSEIAPVIYPGSFIFANTRILTGDPTPVVVRAKRAPYTVSIENLTGINSTTIKVDPSKGSERTQIQEGLNKALNEAFASGAKSSGSLSFTMNQASSAEEMAASIGVSVNAPMIEAEASFGSTQTSEVNTFVARIMQSFYSLRYQPGENLMKIYPEVKKSNALYWDDFLTTVGSEGSAQPIAAVTSLNYGSMLVAIIKSTKSLDEIKASVEVKVGGGGGSKSNESDDDDDDESESSSESNSGGGGGSPSAGFGGGAKASFNKKSTASDMQVTIKGIGLGGAAAKKCVEGVGDFKLLKECMAAMVGFGKENPGSLLSYNVNYVIGVDINNGNSVAGQKVHRIQMTRGGLEKQCFSMSPDKKAPCGQALVNKSCNDSQSSREFNPKNNYQIAQIKDKNYADNPTKCRELCEQTKGCYSWKAAWPKQVGGKLIGDASVFGCYLFNRKAGTDISTKTATYTVGLCNTEYPRNPKPLDKNLLKLKIPEDWQDVQELDAESMKILTEKDRDSNLWWWSSKCHTCPAKFYKSAHKDACWNGTKIVTWSNGKYRLSKGEVEGDDEKGCGVAGCRARCKPTKIEKWVPKW